MKRKCAHCNKIAEFEYWEHEVVALTYPIDEQGHVFCGERKEFPEETIKRFLECSNCGTRYYAKKERNDLTEADLKISMGHMIRRGFRLEDDAQDKEG